MLGGAGNDTISGGTTKYGLTGRGNWIGNAYDRAVNWMVDDGADTLDGGSGIDTLLIRDLAVAWYHGDPEALENADVDLARGILRLDLPSAARRYSRLD